MTDRTMHAELGHLAPLHTQPAVPIPADRVDEILAAAARAPSIFNTQPWRFQVSTYSIDLYVDPGRKLRVDPAGREMLISCGAAL